MGSRRPRGIFVVEDHPVMREMLLEVIERQPDRHVCGTADSAEAALAKLEPDDGVDLILIDLSLPGMNGLDLLRKLGSRHPGTPCLMVSGHAEPEYAEAALEAGARGFVLKGRPTDLPQAIDTIFRGDRFVSEPIRRHMAWPD